jgi:hypothetical protein
LKQRVDKVMLVSGRNPKQELGIANGIEREGVQAFEIREYCLKGLQIFSMGFKAI